MKEQEISELIDYPGYDASNTHFPMADQLSPVLTIFTYIDDEKTHKDIRRGLCNLKVGQKVFFHNRSEKSEVRGGSYRVVDRDISKLYAVDFEKRALRGIVNYAGYRHYTLVRVR